MTNSKTSTPTRAKKVNAPRKTLAEIRQEREALDAIRIQQKRIRQGVLVTFIVAAVLECVWLFSQRPASFSGQILDANTQEAIRTGTIRVDQQAPQIINDVTATVSIQGLHS